VRRQLVARAVERGTGLAGELDLSTGLEGDRRLVTQQRDRPPVLLGRLPAEALGELAQQPLDAVRAGEGRRPSASRIDRQLLVLGADEPALARLRRRVKLVDELRDAVDRHRLAARAEVGHAGRTVAGRRCRRKAADPGTARY